MKELTLKEAYLAMFDGSIVIDSTGHNWRWNEELGRTEVILSENISYFDTPKWEYSTIGTGLAPFTLYKEPVKSLTFEEAMEKVSNNEDIKIVYPTGASRTFGWPDDRHKSDIYLHVDLAERRGWLIEEAKP